MRTFYRYLSLTFLLASLVAIIYGFTIMEVQELEGHRYIGFGVSGIFFLAMPLFLFSESRGKKWENYILNEENIRKMKDKHGKSSGF